MTSSRFIARLSHFDVLLLLGGLIAAFAWIVLFLFTIWPYVSVIAAPQSSQTLWLHIVEFLRAIGDYVANPVNAA